MAKIGDIVTITVDYPAGVEEFGKVKGETGVITNYDHVGSWEVTTGKPKTSGYWYYETEFRPATAEEIADRLRYALMKRRIV